MSTVFGGRNHVEHPEEIVYALLCTWWHGDEPAATKLDVSFIEKDTDDDSPR